MLLDAILSDCDSTVDAIMHAVKWSEPTTIDAQLQISKAVDRKGLTRAFESALIYGTQDENAERVVKTLIDYNADARYVRFDRLFKRSPVDLYGVIEDYKAEKLAKMHGRRRGGREPSLKEAERMCASVCLAAWIASRSMASSYLRAGASSSAMMTTSTACARLNG